MRAFTRPHLAGAASRRDSAWFIAAMWALASLPGAAAGATFELAPAPYREASQDASSWVPRDASRKAARSRADVVSLYKSAYLQGNNVALAWTGSIAGCDPGTTNVDHQQAVIDRVNYFRALVDLPAVTLMGEPETSQAQAAALMMSANNALSHTPPASWLCYSTAGATGAMNTNLALGVRGVAAVDGFMGDAGAGNTAVGHRRWILYPPRASMGTGDIPGGNTPPRPAQGLYVFGPQTLRQATPSGIAWPPQGFVPYPNLPSTSNRWSLSYPGATFANAQVAMSGPNGPIAVTPESVQNGFGDNTIVFLPAGFPYGKPAADTTYNVTVSGIAGAGVPASISYAVTVIDPDAAPPPSATVEVVEFYNAVLDHYFITWIAAEIANLDAGRTPTKWNRTGATFNVYSPATAAMKAAPAGSSPVCRYYIPPGLGDSHFFGRGTAECNATGMKNPSFVLEDPNFMFVFVPVAGVCPAGTSPVYRVFSNRPDANHRYIIDAAIRNQMVGRGWLAEGDGPDLVVMCVPA